MIYSQMILALAKTVGVPGTLLLAICTHESGGVNRVVANDGPSSTFGICQVKYETAKMLGFKGRDKELLLPKVNVEYAAKYLKYQLNRYYGNWCKATAAYNSGTYNPSTKMIGKPRNLKYLKSVALFLSDKEKNNLACGQRKVASE